jgi:hypothetical protein
LFASASAAQAAETEATCLEFTSADQIFYLIGVLSTLLFIVYLFRMFYQFVKFGVAKFLYKANGTKEHKRSFKWPDLGSDEIKVHFNMTYCKRQGDPQLLHAVHMHDDCHALLRMNKDRDDTFFAAGRVCKICLARKSK